MDFLPFFYKVKLWGRKVLKWGEKSEVTSTLTVYNPRSFIIHTCKIFQHSKYIYELLLREVERKGEFLNFKNHI